MEDRNVEKVIVEKVNVEERKIVNVGNEDKRNEELSKLKTKRMIYYVLGTLEVLLALRLVFKILGANTASPFISIIYSITDLFLAPFHGIFRTAVTQGIETESVLEPALIIGMVVYALLAWGIVRLIDIINNRKNI